MTSDGTTHLHNIVSNARHVMSNIIDGSSNNRPISSTSKKLVLPYPLSLPEPEPVVIQLSAAGFPSFAADRLSDLYLSRAREVKNYYEHHLRTTAQSWMEYNYGKDPKDEATALRVAYLFRYTAHLQRFSQLFIQESLRYLPTSQEKSAVPSTGKRAMFNQVGPFRSLQSVRRLQYLTGGHPRTGTTVPRTSLS